MKRAHRIGVTSRVPIRIAWQHRIRHGQGRFTPDHMWKARKPRSFVSRDGGDDIRGERQRPVLSPCAEPNQFGNRARGEEDVACRSDQPNEECRNSSLGRILG